MLDDPPAADEPPVVDDPPAVEPPADGDPPVVDDPPVDDEPEVLPAPLELSFGWSLLLTSDDVPFSDFCWAGLFVVFGSVLLCASAEVAIIAPATVRANALIHFIGCLLRMPNVAIGRTTFRFR
jgi:hypothetical protein